jgi:hypothetical protein
VGYRPYSFFRWRGKSYSIARTGTGNRLASDFEDVPNTFAGNRSSVLDSMGNILKGFEHYTAPVFVGADLSRFTFTPGEVISVRDSMFRIGFLNLDGQVQLPQLSFQYSSVRKLSHNVFLGEGQERARKLVDKNNREYVPDLAVGNVSVAEEVPPYAGSHSGVATSLIKVEFHMPGIGRSSFYMSSSGKIYADLSALNR